MTDERVRVLVVDDEKSIRDLLQHILSEVDYEVVTAANGQEALDKISELKIDVALLDIKMPGMSGMELLHKITANWPETCVVMATAVADAQTAVEAMKLGAYDLLPSPSTETT